MRYGSFLLAVSLLAATPALAGDAEQRAVADRFLGAVKGDSDFVREDFARFPDAASREYLLRLGECRVRYVHRPATSKDGSSTVLVESPDKLAIGLDCEGVPNETPVALSLHFEADKIVKIETHNADLLRGDNG